MYVFPEPENRGQSVHLKFRHVVSIVQSYIKYRDEDYQASAITQQTFFRNFYQDAVYHAITTASQNNQINILSVRYIQYCFTCCAFLQQRRGSYITIPQIFRKLQHKLAFVTWLCYGLQTQHLDIDADCTISRKWHDVENTHLDRKGNRQIKDPFHYRRHRSRGFTTFDCCGYIFRSY